MRRPLRRRPASRVGFTAIELSAVASIIVILALILIPIVRNRVATARLVAAEDDMKTIETAQVMAHADTGYFFRLSDLDNPTPSPTAIGTANDPTPQAYWNRVLAGSDPARVALARSWQGPYTTFNRTKSLPVGTLVGASPPVSTMFRQVAPAGGPAAGTGPILVITTEVQDGRVTHPVDPWGSPYVFFGPEPDAPPTGSTQFYGNVPGVIRSEATESNFGLSVIYSLGPNNLPGSNANPQAENFYRRLVPRPGVDIGTDDDLVRVF